MKEIKETDIRPQEKDETLYGYATYLSALVEIPPVPLKTMHERLRRNWSAYEAITIPSGGLRQQKPAEAIEGSVKPEDIREKEDDETWAGYVRYLASLQPLAAIHQTVIKRLQTGVDPYTAMTRPGKSAIPDDAPAEDQRLEDLKTDWLTRRLAA